MTKPSEATKPGYKIGLPMPDDTTLTIEARERMWAKIIQQVRARETWGQWIKRIVKGWMK